MIDKYLQIKQTNTGKGVFTTIKILADCPILEFSGDIKIENINQDDLQIGPNFYLSQSGNIGDSVRHSCNPNCYIHIVGKRATLYSTYVIHPESELTFDYSCNSTDTLDTWKMECKCGSFNCRKIISGFDYLSDQLKNDYKNNLPLFMNNNIIMKK